MTTTTTPTAPTTDQAKQRREQLRAQAAQRPTIEKERDTAKAALREAGERFDRAFREHEDAVGPLTTRLAALEREANAAKLAEKLLHSESPDRVLQAREREVLLRLDVLARVCIPVGATALVVNGERFTQSGIDAERTQLERELQDLKRQLIEA